MGMPYVRPDDHHRSDNHEEIAGFSKIFGNGGDKERQEGLAEWYDAYYRVIRNQVKRSGILEIEGPVSEAEDVAQDIVVKILQMIRKDTFRLDQPTDRGMKGYLKRAVYNAKTDVLKKKKKRTEDAMKPLKNSVLPDSTPEPSLYGRRDRRSDTDAQVAREHFKDPGELGFGYAPGSWRPDRIVESDESQRRIYNCIASAPKKHQVVIGILSEGLDRGTVTEAIQEAVNAGKKSVGSRVRRAREYVARHVGDICPRVCWKYM
jgi:RNA polymerase sigma factor (sigma-70 family)